ncbi:MAG: hypothetical protein KVP17_004798 [Porospora cf. gigantea B]|uniref:uncharacterized protein n=2 Tax=Porospora cf. gigantea B TaxID=2853592 RepID=UPI003571B016|nr:MAG: hypothetical protein KVP17_004798 [Porospora cf. gigantea B]
MMSHSSNRLVFKMIPFRTASQMSPQNWTELYKMETQNLPTASKENVWYSRQRRAIVSKISQAVATQLWSRATFYVAVSIMDVYFLSCKDHPRDLENVAIACMYFAANVCEISGEDNIVSIANFLRRMNDWEAGPVHRIQQLETHIIDSTQASCLFRKTPLDFLLLYMAALGLDEPLGHSLLCCLVQENRLPEIVVIVCMVANAAWTSGFCMEYHGSEVVAAVLVNYFRDLLLRLNADHTDLSRRLNASVFHMSNLSELQLATMMLEDMYHAAARLFVAEGGEMCTSFVWRHQHQGIELAELFEPAPEPSLQGKEEQRRRKRLLVEIPRMIRRIIN